MTKRAVHMDPYIIIKGIYIAQVRKGHKCAKMTDVKL